MKMPDKSKKRNNLKIAESKQEVNEPDPQTAINAIQATIANAFNLGLQTQPTQDKNTTPDVVKGIEEAIYGQLRQAYGKEVPEDFIKSNAEFFIQVATMGYIIPRICAFDKEFQARFFKLIEIRVLETQRLAEEQAKEEKGKIIQEDKKIIIP